MPGRSVSFALRCVWGERVLRRTGVRGLHFFSAGTLCRGLCGGPRRAGSGILRFQLAHDSKSVHDAYYNHSFGYDGDDAPESRCHRQHDCGLPARSTGHLSGNASLHFGHRNSGLPVRGQQRCCSAVPVHSDAFPCGYSGHPVLSRSFKAAAQKVALGDLQDFQSHWAVLANGLHHHECDRNGADDMLQSSKRPSQLAEVSGSVLWDRRTLRDACWRCDIAGFWCSGLSLPLRVGSLPGAALELPRPLPPSQLVSVFACAVPLGWLVVWGAAACPWLLAESARGPCYGLPSHSDRVNVRDPGVLHGCASPGLAVEAAFDQRLGLLDFRLCHPSCCLCGNVPPRSHR
mmetsp:Transcript_76560/g.183410  ORF Transcript_76560/g.183410 Transcript_76560/m.183410 type:complete len:346 (+) Transcript_76560:1111-2148(+)